MDEFIEKIIILEKSLNKYKVFLENLQILDEKEKEKLKCFNQNFDNLLNKLNDINFEIDEIQNQIDKADIKQDLDVKSRMRENENFCKMYNKLMPLITLYIYNEMLK